MPLIADPDGMVLLHDKHFIKPPLDDKIFAWLKKIPYEQQMGGYGRLFPRLTAYYADKDIPYSYSGVTHYGKGWQPILEELKNRINKAANVEFNSLLINYYRDGKDSISWHADDEKELGPDPVVASLSFGAARNFELKNKKGAKFGKYIIVLEHGSLLVMAGKTQTNWLHSVPKTKEPVGERINLTFRKIY